MLIETITQANYVTKLSKAVTYEKLQPHLKNAEITFIRQALGNDLYDKLSEYHSNTSNFVQHSPNFSVVYNQDKVDAGVTETQYNYSVLLWYAQHAILNLAYSIGFDNLNAFVSDMGFHRQESGNNKGLFKYQEENLKRYFFKTGMDSIDFMLEFLEKNITTFPEFEPELNKLKSRIFPSTAIFNQHYNINNSRIIFNRLKQHIKTTEEITLEPIIGKENLKTILAEATNTTPSTQVLSVIPYLRDVVAYLATVMLMEESGADITERGLYFTENDVDKPTSEPRLKDLVRRNKEIAEKYITRLKQYMLDADWQTPHNPRSHMINRNNTGKKTFWS